MFKNVESKLAKQLTLNKTNLNEDITDLKRELQTTKPKEKRNPSVGLRTATSNTVKLPDINKYNKNINNNNNIQPQKNEKKEQKKEKLDPNDSTSDANIQVIRHVPNSNLLKEEQVLANIKKKLNKNGTTNHGNNNNQHKQNTNDEENIYNHHSNNNNNINVENDNIDALMKENEILQKRLNELNQQDDLSNRSVENKESKPTSNAKRMKSAGKGNVTK